MIHASLVVPWCRNNEIFRADSPLNRDGTFEPYIRLRGLFLARGIMLETDDHNAERNVEFELHQDVQREKSGATAYLMLFETPLVKPQNGDSHNWVRYKRVFTWRDDLVDGDRFVKINFPNPLTVPAVDGWRARDHFCCVIAGNKAVAIDDDRALYTERVRTIRWFECHAPVEFDLYGIDWDLPPLRQGLLGKVQKRLWRHASWLAPPQPFPSYRGSINSKRDVLLHTRFSICYENVRDLPGYITEKMFDCFFSGCVPVYWGASNITDYIPADCFIDRRQFSDIADVYRRLKSISEEEFRDYQQRIAEFLASDAARPFSSEAFAEIIVNTVVSDLGDQS